MDKNESAFPIFNLQEGELVSPGLSKRELFAAMAMQGLAQTEFNDTTYGVGGRTLSTASENRARCAISMADALLKELAKGGGS